MADQRHAHARVCSGPGDACEVKTLGLHRLTESSPLWRDLDGGGHRSRVPLPGGPIEGFQLGQHGPQRLTPVTAQVFQFGWQLGRGAAQVG